MMSKQKNTSSHLQQATKRACSALAESDSSSDYSSVTSSCQLFLTSRHLLEQLYALKNTLQSSIISDHVFERAMGEQAFDDFPTQPDEPLCIQVLQQLLQLQAFHTIVRKTPEEYMAMTTIPNGRFIVHETVSQHLFAIRRSSQRHTDILLDATLATKTETWSFGETISETHHLYQVVMHQQHKRKCSTPAKIFTHIQTTTESLSQTSIVEHDPLDDDEFSVGSDDRFGDDDNESGADVEDPPDSIIFNQELSQLKLLQCVYCLEVVSTKRNARDVTSFRCPKCQVIFRKRDNVNFCETEAGHPGLRLYIYHV